jgi:rhodanese-related sulfurtransferase
MPVIHVSPDEALGLVARGEVLALDVRTRQEFVQLGHIPGAKLLPVDLVASALAVADPAGPPVLVYCEHGVRSAHAADLLDRAGLPNVLNMTGGMSCWTGPRAHDDEELWGPSDWLVDHAAVLRGATRVLDVACGRGRHALLLAGAGFDVTALDRDPESLAHVARMADRLQWPVRTISLDLETFPAPSIEPAGFDVILVFRYLFRPLFPSLARALAPGGRLVYETFLKAQAAVGHPKSARFLLEPGELVGLLRSEGLEVVASREGFHRGCHVASAVARRH